LLNRTTRSVALTDAGLRLLGRAPPVVEQISRALDDLNSEQEHPFGRLRFYVSHFAGVAVIAPIWSRFLSTFPHVQLEMHAAEALVQVGTGQRRDREPLRSRVNALSAAVAAGRLGTNAS